MEFRQKEDWYRRKEIARQQGKEELLFFRLGKPPQVYIRKKEEISQDTAPINEMDNPEKKMEYSPIETVSRKMRKHSKRTFV